MPKGIFCIFWRFSKSVSYLLLMKAKSLILATVAIREIPYSIGSKTPAVDPFFEII